LKTSASAGVTLRSWLSGSQRFDGTCRPHLLGSGMLLAAH